MKNAATCHCMRGSRRLLAAALSLTAACAAAAEAPRPLRIVTSFYPMYIHVLNVAAGIAGVEVRNLTPPVTGCLHDYQLRPADLVTLTQADVFVVNGAGMESFLDEAVRQVPKLRVVTASDGIDLLRHGEEENPHVWVSVSGAIRQVENIAAGLAAADPVRAEGYRRNAAAYVERLAELRDAMHAGLRDLRSRDIVTFHEAFPYFAREFDLRIVAVVQREPGSEPGARELADTITLVRRTGVRALFAEPQYSAKAAEAIARETGATLYRLDPAVTGADRADAYLDIMRQNLETLRRALR